MDRMKRRASASAGALVLATTTTGIGAEAPTVAHGFDPEQQELPEAAVFAADGTAYVSMGLPFFLGPNPGWVKRVDPDGTVTTLAAFDVGAPAGIALDADGVVHVARPMPEDESIRGVYRIESDGSATRLPGSEGMLVPNGIAFDANGGLYVGASILGAVWYIPPGGPAEPWFTDAELVAGCAEGDVGANGVALHDGALYVANLSRGLLVRVPIEDDGSAGAGEIVAGDATNGCEPDALFGIDGIAIASDGTVFAGLVLQHRIVRIDPSDGSVEVLLTEADGLHNPSDVLFGVAPDDRQGLYITNYAVLPPVPEASLGPGLLRLDGGVDGAPLG